MSETAPRPLFVPAPPFPSAYGLAAALALGLGLAGGFGLGLYGLGVLAFGWPAGAYAPLVQAHGQVQTLGLAGLLVVGVGGLLLPAFWRIRLERPRHIAVGSSLVGLGLLGQLVGQPLPPSAVREVLLSLAALLPIAGFGWAGLELARTRVARGGGMATWEAPLLLAGASLLGALLLRAADLIGLAWSGLPASFGALHQALILLELYGFLLAATLGVEIRLLPSLARTRPSAGWPEWLGTGMLAAALLLRLAGLTLLLPALTDLGVWLTFGALVVLFWALGLGRRGVPPSMEAPAAALPGRTRVVLRVAWGGLLLGELGRATGWLSPDAATHALTSVYLVPLILVVGLRMLPRVSAYPVRFPTLSGALVWAGLLGGVGRAFGSVLGGQPGWQLAWAGGLLVTVVLLIFAALAWSPWGVPTGQPREPERRRHGRAARE